MRNKSMHITRERFLRGTVQISRMEFSLFMTRDASQPMKAVARSLVLFWREYKPGHVTVMSSRLSTVLPEASKRALQTVSLFAAG